MYNNEKKGETMEENGKPGMFNPNNHGMFHGMFVYWSGL